MRLFSTWLALVPALLAACGDDKATPDANTPIDGRPVDSSPPVDAAPVADFSWDEGGESRIEYQEFYDPMNPTVSRKQARATAFFWKSKTPKRYEFPLIPGCTKMDMDDRFPLGMGTTHEYLDVGQVIYSGGGMQLNMPAGSNVATGGMNRDGMARPHDGTWKFFVGSTAGLTYFGNWDTQYDAIFTGSDAWPAQVHKDAHYMPSAWTLGTPGLAPIQLQADTPLVITYTPGPNTNKPPGSALNMVAALIVPGMGPVVDCIEDSLDGSITIPADMVNHARSLGGAGLLARAHLSHQVRELTDGVTHDRKRIDFISIWCYVSPWTAAP
ncbi:MAG: hypothetical protein JWP01_1843 [Myxococcales bacterium]|nr:hypothetical protein [Myxococcales bacterium]